MFEGLKKSGVLVDLLFIRLQSNQGRYATMSKSTVVEPEDREGIADPLTELLREGTQQLI